MQSETGLTSDKIFLAIATALVAMGCIYAYATAPTRLTVAVGPIESPDARLLKAFADQLKQQRSAVRLQLRPVEDVRAAGEALDAQKVDLAVIRADVALPSTGLTVAILRDAATILIAPPSAGIEGVAGLAGKNLGVLIGHEADPRLLEQILGHFDLHAPSLTITPLAREVALAALVEGRVDALALVSPPAGTVTSEFVRAAAAAFEGRIAVIPIENASALVQRSPTMEAATIPEGVWGGRPPRPDREIKTVGVSYRLMARDSLDRSTVALVAESLFQMRSKLAMTARSAIFMRAPETDTASSATSAALPNHPGAVDYFQREQQTLMDRYGDWVYLVAFFGSGLVSAAAGLTQRFRRHRREAIDDVLDRLLTILSDARQAETRGRLDELAAEVDDLLAVAVGHARTGASGTRTTTATVLAIEGARGAIAARARQIRHGQAEPPRRDEGPPRLAKAS